MTVDAKSVKKLRDMTQAGMMDCKKALADAGGDFDKAKKLVRERGQAKVDKKDRAIEAGWIGTYVHKGKIGAMVEVGCNTDFVAMSDDFQKLAFELAKGVVALNPEFVTSDDIPAEAIEEEKKKYADAIKGKPPEIQDKIIKGKLDKTFFAEKCLLHMTVPDEELFKGTYSDYVKDVAANTGETVKVTRFVRYELGI